MPGTSRSAGSARAGRTPPSRPAALTVTPPPANRSDRRDITERDAAARELIENCLADILLESYDLPALCAAIQINPEPRAGIAVTMVGPFPVMARVRR
ncbi:hypothetical protein GCM10009682_01430 [Luedemannella flava]|uniref:Uncharacterized protein n=1 Tax=Luedemannella flava TaxID=349316 RepID=A0ABN2LDM9_9ACTN